MLAAADDDDADSTLAANPYLKAIFGYSSDAGDADLAPFAAAIGLALAYMVPCASTAK